MKRPRFRAGYVGIAIVVFAAVVSQQSAASAVVVHPIAQPAERPAQPLVAGSNLLAATTHCNGPSFTPPSSTNTTNAGSQSFLALTGGIATPNLWNTKSSRGSIAQCYNSSTGYTSTVNLSSLSIGPTQGPAGYPEIAYGESAYGGRYCATGVTNCTIAPFPLTVSNLAKYPYLTKISYSLGTISPTQYWHLTYDLWLVQSLKSAGPQAGDVEILISPYNGYPGCGTARGTVSIGGDTWSMYQGCGATKATLLAFILKSPAQRRSATFDLNISSFVSEVKKLLPTDASIANEEMPGLEVGIEFDNYHCAATCAPQQSSAKFHWAVSSLSVVQYSAASKTYKIVG
jgi:hypothetical protein